MTTLLRQEMFKLRHQNITWITVGFNLIVMTLFAVLTKLKPTWFDANNEVAMGFSGTLFLVFFLIGVASTIVAAEFQYGTIKALLYRKYYRGQVFASKVVTLLVYSIINYIIIFGYTMVLKLILFGNVDLTAKIGKTTIIGQLGLNLLGSFVGLWLILALVLLIANLFKTSSAAITIGILSYFAASILQVVQSFAIQKWNWLKWNPLNMLNAGAQIKDSTLHSFTKLSLTAITTGSIVYTLIFLLIGYYIFKKRNV
ncbi:ABC transporter permease [Periweissella fabalis]|uniref:ABC transporter permease subunit n=1 Tax=Periweissella fabalis TaxID=1070421 RepID=A0A7X6S1S9_9LACO|nr:ABC transporter permease [Periweissella fabalis]MCM0599049.1 ABC transporter permease [Periweissella fabalis]NKZ23329.1 ABC transporter permease subunit [Periweissella fabalis]